MGILDDTIGNKDAGQLIRHSDWNTLVKAIDQQQADMVDLTEKVAEVEGLKTTVQAIDQRLQGIEATMETFAKISEILLKDYYKLTLKTTRFRYPVGEFATITAKVTNFKGEPLDLSTSNKRPWIDFMGTWGVMKAPSHFNSRVGMESRTISVQVNEQGEAMVFVHAEHGLGIPGDVEIQVADALKSQISVNGQNRSLNTLIMEAETPMEVNEHGAFKFIRNEYDREDVAAVRRYVDVAWSRYKPIKRPDIIFRPSKWRDFRTTVMAMVKDDADPTTADHSKAQASIQLVFRDWISPFVELDYLKVIEPKVKIFREKVRGGIVPRFDDTLVNVKERVKEFLGGKGWVGQQRNLKVVRQVIDELQIDNPPDFLPNLKSALRDAVDMQQQISQNQLDDASLTMDIFTNTSLRSQVDTANISNEVNVMRETVAEVTAEFSELKGLETTLKTDINQRFSQIHTDINENQAKLQTLNDKVVVLDRSKITLDTGVSDLRNQFGQMETQLSTVRTNVNEINRVTQEVRTKADLIGAKNDTLFSTVSRLEGLNASDVTVHKSQIANMLNRINNLERT